MYNDWLSAPRHYAAVPKSSAVLAAFLTRILHQMQVGWTVPCFLSIQGKEMSRNTLTNPAQILKRTRSIYRIAIVLIKDRPTLLIEPVKPWLKGSSTFAQMRCQIICGCFVNIRGPQRCSIEKPSMKDSYIDGISS